LGFSSLNQGLVGPFSKYGDFTLFSTQDVVTWAHFFQEKPTVPLAPAFFLFPQVAKIRHKFFLTKKVKRPNFILKIF